VLGALLGTCLILLSLNIAAGALFTPHNPSKPGYAIAVPETGTGDQKGPTQEADAPIATRLASADVARGENSVKKCVACHTLGKGEPNRVGPNLWAIVGRKKASETGFNYSGAMKNEKGTWTFEALDAYLKNPRGVVPGTNMSFAGIPRASERADLIAYLNTKSDSPEPLPRAAETPAPPVAPRQAATPPTAAPAPAEPPAAAPAVESPPAAALPAAEPPASPPAAVPEPPRQ
jgi:cytochrome c